MPMQWVFVEIATASPSTSNGRSNRAAACSRSSTSSIPSIERMKSIASRTGTSEQYTRTKLPSEP